MKKAISILHIQELLTMTEEEREQWITLRIWDIDFHLTYQALRFRMERAHAKGDHQLRKDLSNLYSQILANDPTIASF